MCSNVSLLRSQAETDRQPTPNASVVNTPSCVPEAVAPLASAMLAGEPLHSLM